MEHTFRCESLCLVLDCEQPFSGSMRFDLTDVDEVSIGRGAERRAVRDPASRSLLIGIPDPRISSSHARLRRVGSHWLIEDLESTNGLLVLGQRVRHARLQDDGIFVLGRTCFLFSTFTGRTRPSARDVALPIPEGELGLATLNQRLQERLGELVAVARDGVPILLEGEPGTGKEKLARTLHDKADRAGAFVAIDCRTLAEADTADAGAGPLALTFAAAIARAESGTLFLHNVDVLSSAAQICLLGAIDTHERLAFSGLDRSRPVSLICSVRPASRSAPGHPSLRRDLHASIAGFVFSCPPLRQRREDLSAIALFFLGQAVDREGVSIDTDFFHALMSHDWPGNLRELENYARTAGALAVAGRIVRLPINCPRPESESPAPSGPAEALEPDPDFVRDVRRALRGGLTVASLKHSPLLASHMVRALTRDTDPAVVRVQVLRDVLQRAVDSLQTTPRREKLYEVVRLTFIQPAQTQYEAAERLSMAFGTYRRHVTTAIAELVSVLWFQEQQARVRAGHASPPLPCLKTL